MKRGVLVNEKLNHGVRERKKFGIHWSKTRDFLVLLFSNFALEYAIKKVEENQVRPKMSGTHHPLVYADDVNLLRGNIDTMEKNT
jgi:hypothetical protein